MTVLGIPRQIIPVTSSDERMHVMDETCWCSPIRSVGRDDLLLHHDQITACAAPYPTSQIRRIT